MPESTANQSRENIESSVILTHNETIPPTGLVPAGTGPDASPGNPGTDGPGTVVGPGNGALPAAIPQPSGLALLALGAGGLLALRRRHKGG